MGLLIVNGSVKAPEQVRSAIEMLTQSVPEHHVIDASALRIEPCKGCYCCMLVTPGRCCIHDDAEKLLRAWVQYDQIVFLLDTHLRFLDAKGKTIIDRLLPSINMDVQCRNGEVLHAPRYDHQPRIALIYTGDADRGFMNLWLNRMTNNLGGIALGAVSTDEVPEVVKWIS